MKHLSPAQQRALTLERIRKNPKLMASIEAAVKAQPELVARAVSPDSSRSPEEAVNEVLTTLTARRSRAIRRAEMPPRLHVAEAIILRFGRPVLFVQRDTFDSAGTEYWEAVLNEAKPRLQAAALSIGRIEVENVPGYEWLGTGWLIDEDIVLTNRHVAQEFGRADNGGFSFKRSFLGLMSARIDFREEFQDAAPVEFEITQILDIVPEPGVDMAFLRVHWTADADHAGRRPIQLSTAVAATEEIAIIGYPAKDSRTRIPDEMDRIFGNVFDVKRLAPGEVTEVSAPEGIFTHDCTTLGGNSGSAAIHLATGSAVGLHFAGLEERANYGVLAATIQQRLAQVRGRSRVVVPQLVDLAAAAEVNRSCRLTHYEKVEVPALDLRTDFVAYASPDSTYAVSKRLIEQARRSILIGIYDFSAAHLKTLLLEAMDRGVSVSLMLDIDKAEEKRFFEELRGFGVNGVPAPSCASENISYFASSHEKVIVIDDVWTLVQSGNWSNNSIPKNDEEGEAARQNFKHGNRDMGIAVKSTRLATFFRTILRADMKLELDAAREELPRPERIMPAGEFLLEAPTAPPTQLFSSKKIRPTSRIPVQPVLSPDNYMDVIPSLLENAQESIEIEQQYIKAWQPLIHSLCAAITTARQRNPNLEVRIIIAPGFDSRDTDKQLDTLETDFDLRRGEEVRLLNPAHFVHCHNKLLIVDRRHVLISSQNWSDFAVGKNREAGLLLDYPELAEYYGEIFDHDWSDSVSADEEGRVVRELFARESLNLGRTRVRATLADFEEV